jgi:predicted ATPase
MEPSVIEDVQLTAFKSFRDAVLPLDDLTLLVGRNGSGKSNALDGLWVLSRLAAGDDIRESLDGGKEGPTVRGGVEGCAPAGSSSFALGCSVRTGADVVRYEVSVQTVPTTQVLREALWRTGELMLETDPPIADSSDIKAHWDRAPVGLGRSIAFRANRLGLTQVLSRVPATDEGQLLHLAAAQVIAALRQVFVLDPVPHEMRQYVREADTDLRRNAENLSAAVARLVEDPANRDRLIGALNRLNEHEVVDLTQTVTPLGDVMLMLVERAGQQTEQVPIRQASDGTLRFLAVLTALMQEPTDDRAPQPLAAEDTVGSTTLVIEELENGLHASQAATMIDLIRDEVRARRVRTLATVHSPAMLDALSGDEHRNVIVCQRGPDGRSQLARLVELPGYFKLVAQGTLGRAAVADRLRGRDEPGAPSSFLDDILAG